MMVFVSGSQVANAASCSSYAGRASINEFFKDNSNQSLNTNDFVEVKIIDSTIDSSVYSNWTIDVCELDSNGQNDEDGCLSDSNGGNPVALGNFSEIGPPWLVLKGNVGLYFNLRTGFDAILRDASGDVIDYVSVGYSFLEDAGCPGADLPYPFSAGSPGNSDKFVYRSPDGTGDWEHESSASEEPTEDDTNGGEAAAVAEYLFEELVWNGSSDEVLDSSGNGLHGTAQSGATTSISSPAPAINNNPGTCRYGEFIRANEQYVSVADNDLLDITDQLTISVWVNPYSLAAVGSANSDSFRTVISKDRAYELHVYQDEIRGSFFSSSWQAVTSTGAALSANNWYHIALTYTDGGQKIYLNGQQIASGNLTGILNVSNSDLFIGSDLNKITQRSFDGAIDEVRFFNSALSDAQIASIYYETHPCDSLPLGVDHFDIDHNGSAIYCQPTPVVVMAEDVSNNTLTTYTGEVSLNTNSGIGDWSLNSGAGLLDNGAENDGIATYRFDSADNGVAVFNLDHGDTNTTTPLSINIAVSEGSATDDDLEGLLSFSASGFTLTGQPLVNNPPNPIDTNLPVAVQTAGTDFSLYIAAYGQLPGDASCGVIESYQGSKALNFSFAYNDPSTGTIMPTVNGNPISLPSAVNFVQGQAECVVKYKDVGKISLAVTDSVLIGSSNPFVVKPARFDIQLLGNPGATTAGGGPATVFTTAGTDFPVTVYVRDSEGDLTPNYGKETSAETVGLTHSRVLPDPAVSGVDGVLSGSLTRTADATFTGNYQWNEVGIIDLHAAVGDADYLAAGNVVTSLSTVGRFIPHHFQIMASVINAADASGATPYTYMGQAFSVSYDIQAMAADGSYITRNYEGDFAYGFALDYGAVSGSSSLNTRIGDTAIVQSDWLGGEVTVLDELVIDKLATPDGPYSAIDVGVIFSDPDGVSVLAAAIDLDTDPVSADDRVNLGALPGELRFGRIYIPPVYGPELSAGETTDIPFVVQYWDGSNFVINSDDSTTVYDTWSANCIAGTVACTAITIPDAPAVLVNGESDPLSAITIERPGAGNTGELTIELEVDPWLQYDWSGTGDENPRAQVHFGLYRGHDRIIYWRELNN
jgi:MSHA biogenesis protein MshQ